MSGILGRRRRPRHDPDGPPPRRGRVCWRLTSGQMVCTAWVEASLAQLWYDEARAHLPGMEHKLELRGGAPDPDTRDLDVADEGV